MWSVGQKMWQRDFPGIYEVLNREWPENLKPTMNALHGKTSHLSTFNLDLTALNTLSIS